MMTNNGTAEEMLLAGFSLAAIMAQITAEAELLAAFEAPSSSVRTVETVAPISGATVPCAA